jgi:hypothetical protein
MANEWSKIKIDTTDLKPEYFAQPIVESPHGGIPTRLSQPPLLPHPDLNADGSVKE